MQPTPDGPVCGVDDSITGYRISGTGITPINKTKEELMCTDEQCMYKMMVPQNTINYTVMVAARNQFGLGAATTVGPYSECRYVYYSVCSKQTFFGDRAN